MGILLLGQPNDETLVRFAAFAEKHGQACVIAPTWSDLNCSVQVERTGSVRVRLEKDRTPFQGIINRGVSPAQPADADQIFLEAESLATWWSALACFPGPVINRPSRWGFVPHLELLTLARLVPGVVLAPAVLSTTPVRPAGGPEVNIHCVRDRSYVGRFSSLSARDYPRDVYVSTAFDPERTRALLLVGQRLFDLSTPTGEVERELSELLVPCVQVLQQRQATFCSLIIEWNEAGLRFLSLNAFPLYYHYQRLAERVHQALLEYLQS
jgi:hypothetical protein